MNTFVNSQVPVDQKVDRQAIYPVDLNEFFF